MWHYVSQYLLLVSDELDLQNFGKITVKTTPAAINEKEQKISPPKRTFAFLQIDVKQTSDNFIDFLAKELGKDKKYVQDYVSKQISEAKEKLNKGEKIELPLIGYLQAIDRNVIKLAQTTTYSLSPDNFGATDIPLPEKVQRQPQAAKQKKQKKSKPKAAKTAPAATEKIEKEKSAEEKTFNYGLWLKRAAILTAVAAVVILVILFFKPISGFVTDTWQKLTYKTDTVGTTEVVSTTPSAQVTEDTGATGQNTPAIDTQQNVTAGQETQSQSTAATQADADQILAQVDKKYRVYIGSQYKHYYPIVGSFSSYENAEKFRRQLLDEGYKNAQVLTADPQHNRVTIGGFDDVQKAVDAYNGYKSRFPDRGIWLLINEQ